MTRHVAIAQDLRRSRTEAEGRLWSRLRDRRLAGLKFRRRAPLGGYVVDFCCEAAHLIVEVDGGPHAGTTDSDLDRTMDLEAMGYRVLRFWNDDVLTNTDGVLESILDTLDRYVPLSPHPNPLPAGAREQN
jgi:lysyl-tRNA synthetase class 2